MSQPAVVVEVRFRLQLEDGTPVAGAPVRLVMGEGPGWQAAEAGARLQTDARGEARLPVSVPLGQRRRKLPTNFFTQLASARQDTLHITVAAELPYMGRPWLYAATVDRFPNGTSVQLEGTRVFGPDPQGRFTQPGRLVEGDWVLPGVDGRLTVPGHVVRHLVLEPVPTGWRLEVVLYRQPEPVRR